MPRTPSRWSSVLLILCLLATLVPSASSLGGTATAVAAPLQQTPPPNVQPPAPAPGLTPNDVPALRQQYGATHTLAPIFDGSFSTPAKLLLTEAGPFEINTTGAGETNVFTVPAGVDSVVFDLVINTIYYNQTYVTVGVKPASATTWTTRE